MVEQVQEATSAVSPQAGPSEAETYTHFDNNMSERVAQLIGRQLAQIGDELNSRWREKLANQWPTHHRWQAYANVLNLGAFNRRMVASIWWSKFLPMVGASWMVPQFHIKACQTANKWIRWIYNPNFAYWFCRTKYVLAPAILLVTAAALSAVWKMFES
ncbi:bcl-2-interacting killer [Hoplias malabaricus]|uniref:bcl-2-interacting killer n=1 Tax=Hoplias malabaricus TaxID=27720 RepID=UPI003462E421